MKFACVHCGGPMRRAYGGWRCQQAVDAFNADLLEHRENLADKYGEHLWIIDTPTPAQAALGIGEGA